MGLRTKIRKSIANIKYPMKAYVPLKKSTPKNSIEVSTAWKGLEMVIEDILDRFDVGRDSCIEFGVEFCYSTVVFSNFFKKVNGIDIFIGDVHSGQKKDHYLDTKKSVAPYKNIELFQSDYRDWIKKDQQQYDFAHVDIIHTYQETFECGLWAAQHSKCCIFHDTESFTEVKRAVYDIAKATGKTAYNYPFHNGLGIVV